MNSRERVIASIEHREPDHIAVDVGSTPSSGISSIADVKEHVRRNIEILAPGGGFVFTNVHNIMPDVPAENIAAMFEAIDEFR